MKKILMLFISIILIVACSDEPPSIRVSNQNPNKTNVQIKLSNANTININDVQPNATTNYQEIVDGVVVATAVIQNEKTTPSNTFSAAKNRNYTVVIQNSTPPTIKIDSSDK